MKYLEYRGIENLVASELTEDSAEKLEYGEVRRIAGIKELTKETESSSETKYYDNIPALVIDSVGADTVKMNVSAVDLSTMAWLTGQDYDEETGALLEGERKSKYFALGYITQDTDGNKIYVWRLKGKFGIPSSTHATKDDGTDANGQELEYTGINTAHKFAKTKKSAKSINVEEIKGLADLTDFFENVKTPDSLKAIKVTSAEASGETKAKK